MIRSPQITIVFFSKLARWQIYFISSSTLRVYESFSFPGFCLGGLKIVIHTLMVNIPFSKKLRAFLSSILFSALLKPQRPSCWAKFWENFPRFRVGLLFVNNQLHQPTWFTQQVQAAAILKQTKVRMLVSKETVLLCRRGYMIIWFHQTNW